MYSTQKTHVIRKDHRDACKRRAVGILAHGRKGEDQRDAYTWRKVKDHRNVCHDGKEKSY